MQCGVLLPALISHYSIDADSYRRLKSEPNSSVSCSIDTPPQNSKHEEHSQATPSRPCTLTLGAKNQRMPSSDSSGKVTPAAAPDPPIFSPEGLQQYPLGSHQSRSTSSPFPLSGEVQSQSHLCAAQVSVLLAELLSMMYSALLAYKLLYVQIQKCFAWCHMLYAPRFATGECCEVNSWDQVYKNSHMHN